MQRDLKIGLSLGVLLVGVVGAFFNRREIPTSAPAEPLQTTQHLDERIAERPRKPYLTGIEADDFPAPSPNPKRPPLRQSPPQFNLEEFAADHEVPSPEPESKQRAAVPMPSDEPQAVTAERPKPQAPASNAVTERAPSVHSISITSNGPRSAQKSPELPGEASTVPSADALDGESHQSGSAVSAPPDASKQGPLFTRPDRSPFARSSKQATDKSNAKSRAGQAPDSKGKNEAPSTLRQAAKGNQAKASGDPDGRSPAAPAGNVTPGLYKVKPGDSLDKIALQYYRNKSKAHAIFEANKDKLKSPDSIREGMQIKLP